MGDGARGGRGEPGASVFARRGLRPSAGALPAGSEFVPGGVVLRGPCPAPFIGFGAVTTGCRMRAGVSSSRKLWRSGRRSTHPWHVAASQGEPAEEARRALLLVARDGCDRGDGYGRKAVVAGPSSGAGASSVLRTRLLLKGVFICISG